jgi:hypothetical protein
MAQLEYAIKKLLMFYFLSSSQPKLSVGANSSRSDFSNFPKSRELIAKDVSLCACLCRRGSRSVEPVLQRLGDQGHFATSAFHLQRCWRVVLQLPACVQTVCAARFGRLSCLIKDSASGSVGRYSDVLCGWQNGSPRGNILAMIR